MRPLDLQTLAGVLEQGNKVAALLVSPTVSIQKLRLGSVMDDPAKLEELTLALNYLRDHLHVMALSIIPMEGGSR